MVSPGAAAVTHARGGQGAPNQGAPRNFFTPSGFARAKSKMILPYREFFFVFEGD